jgi:hypothetical protein
MLWDPQERSALCSLWFTEWRLILVSGVARSLMYNMEVVPLFVLRATSMLF